MLKTLMRVIEGPNTNISVVEDLSEQTLFGLLSSAVKNKVPLLFLNRALKIQRNSDSLRSLHDLYLEKSQVALNLAKIVSNNLVGNGINYVFFKTFKRRIRVQVDDFEFMGPQDRGRTLEIRDEILDR